MADRVPSVGRFAAAHGTAKACGTEVVFEAVPDGVRDAEPSRAATEPKPAGKPFTSETAKSAAHRRWALAKVPDFARTELEYVATEAFAPFDDGRRTLLDAKGAEIVAMTGEAGVGVMTTLRGYSWLVAFAEFYAVRAAKAGSDRDADRARHFFKDASIELAKAHELARAEAAARPARRDDFPWFEPAPSPARTPAPARTTQSTTTVDDASTGQADATTTDPTDPTDPATDPDRSEEPAP